MIKHIGTCIGIDHRADKIIETFSFINIHHVTFHRQRRHVNHRRTILPDMIREDIRLINRLPTHASHVIRFRQHFTTDKINGEFFQFFDSLIRIMPFTHTHEYTIVTDNTRVCNKKPIYFSFHFCSNHRCRFRIESQQASEIFLFYFHDIGLIRVLFYCRVA